MPEVLDLFAHLGYWSVDAWWFPLTLWTLCALVMWQLDTRTALRRPLVRQRMLLAALVAFPLGIALRAAAPLDAPEPVAPLLQVFSLGEITVTASGAAASSATPAAKALDVDPTPVAMPPLGALILGTLTVLAGLAAAGGAGRVCVQHIRLVRWLRTLPDHRGDEEVLRRLVPSRDIRGARLRVVDADVSPFTWGCLRPVVVVPSVLLADAPALRLAVAHEMAHVRNADALWHGLGSWAAALIPWHPLAFRLLEQATLRREQAADAEVLGRYPSERRPYAHLLLRFGTLPAPAAALSVPVHHLQPRVHAMKHLLDLRARGFLPAALLLFSLTFALSLQAQTPPTPEVFVVVEQPPQLVGGLEVLQSNIRYPEVAKRAGIQGRVVVQFVVDETGKVQDAEVIRGIGAGADAEALRVVRAATFTAGMQRGKVVKTRMTLPITFTLPDAPPPPDTPPAPDAAPAPTPPPAPLAPTDEVFMVVEQMPALVGGLSGLASQIKYPQIAKDAGIEGRVVVQFVVGKDGGVRDARVVRGAGSGLDEEALRVVRAARFTPGVQRGQAVNTQMALPITFKLGAEETAQTSRPSLQVLHVQRTGTTLTGTVLDGGTGLPVAGASVVVGDVGAATDREGRFVVKNLSAGAETLRVTAPGQRAVSVSLSEALGAEVLPEGYVFERGTPNPFSGDQTIRFAVPEAGPVSLAVYNALGQRVAVLFDGMAAAGETYRVTFDGSGHESGLYFYRITHKGRTFSRTGTLAR